MKKLNTTTLALLSCVMLITSCNKAPTADFTIEKSEYVGGDTVKCTNKSNSARTYKWTLPDGQTSSDKDLKFALPANASLGTYTIKLEAKNKKGKTDEGQKSFSVVESGELMVYTTGTLVSTSNPMSVKIDGIERGNVTLYYINGSPDCGAPGCVTVKLPVGEHEIIIDNIWKWTMEVYKDDCVKLGWY